MEKSKLFLASCISLVTTAMVFAIRGDIANDMAAAFHLSNEQLGLIFSPAFWCFTIAIFISGALVDAVGMRMLHILSALGYFVGITLVVLAPRPKAPVASIFDHAGTALLYAGFMIMGMSQGLVEGVINPLIATVYNDRKTQRLNMLHAWWPGGMIVGGLVAVAMTAAFHARWEAKLATILVPALVYLIMAISLRYPQTERVQNNVSNADMWREALRPGFVLLFCCMWLTAAIELGPDQWFPSVMQALAPQLQGVLYLVYTAGLVFLLRTFGGGVAHGAPLATLLVCSVLAGVGLLWLGSLGSASPFVAFAAATVFGIGKAFLWPTMLGVTSQQYPRGGALLMCLMGGAGMLSVAVALPLMGARIDKFGAGAALQMMAALSVPLAVVFGGMILYRMRSRQPQAAL
ncbi:MFS transporter [Rudaea sp.]|uniref:MFS transporter n=1 Tax=Rudaea sp. TaxID=2136325 RepID=UPI002ED16152